MNHFLIISWVGQSFKVWSELTKKKKKVYEIRRKIGNKFDRCFNNWLSSYYFCWKNIKMIKVSVGIYNAKTKGKNDMVYINIFKPKIAFRSIRLTDRYINFSAVIWLSLHTNNLCIVRSKHQCHSVILARIMRRQEVMWSISPLALILMLHG